MGRLDQEAQAQLLAQQFIGTFEASSTADYIADMADELSAMARTQHLGDLAALLKLAAVEARRLSRPAV